MKRRWFGIVVGVCGAACVFGVICTLGVAWTIALAADLHTFRGQYRTGEAEWRTPAYLADVLPAPKAGREMPGRVSGYRQIATEFPVPTERGLDGGWFTVWSSEFGWPLYAVRWDSLNYRPMKAGAPSERVGAIKAAFPERVGLHAGVDLGPLRAGEKPRTLPTGVIWSGFLANTALYGAVGAVVGCGAWGGWRVVRTRVRVRRGRCIGCGYEVRGLAKCPECGRENRGAGEGASGRAA